MNWETLLCIGDSITIGARSYLGYPEYLGNILRENTASEWNVINQATSGYLVRDTIRNITADFTNIKNQNPSIAFILIGTNDVKLNTPLPLFEIAYSQLITKVKLLIQSKNIFLIQIPHFVKGVKYPYTYQMNDIIPKYNGMINDLADRYDLRSIKLDIDNTGLFDGVHLNEKGSKQVAQQLSVMVLKDKGYEGPPNKP